MTSSKRWGLVAVGLVSNGDHGGRGPGGGDHAAGERLAREWAPPVAQC
jgi:hypothetical protein